MFKLALNAGHYLGTPGKRCLKALDPNETSEWWLNDRIADKIEAKLKRYEGIEVLRLDDTTGKTDVSLRDRTDKANKWGADFYLSIHHNAGDPTTYKRINGIKCLDGGGIVAIVYDKTKRQESLDWQKALYNSLIQHTGLKGNRATPLARMNLHEVRESHMASCLLELGFMDSASDLPLILTEAYAEKCANAIVEVVVKKAHLTEPVSDIEFVQKKCGFSDNTIDYLCDYKYAVDLFRKLRDAMK